MATKRLTIITGGSRGLGHCLVQACLDIGDVLNVSRQPARRIESPGSAGAHSVAGPHRLHNLPLDLGHPSEVEPALDVWLAAHPDHTVETLIHNAACLNLGWLTDVAPGDLATAFAVNVFSPLAITARVFQAGRFAQRACRVAYVISSLARHDASLSFAGLGVYSATKAALSRLALIQSREFELAAPHIKVLRIHPGIVDTEIQRELRQHPTLDPAFAAKTAGLPPYREGDWIDRAPSDAMRTISAELAAEFVMWAMRSPDATSDEYDFYHSTPFHAARREREIQGRHA
ncbi:MAG TPA: SDR family NAD(P)-dependent oxidoreductase [Kofleriaceae bacterium]